MQTNEDTVKEIQAGVNLLANLEKLYNDNIGLIRQIARHYAPYSEMEDLMQEAYFGLYNAAVNYDPEAGASFGAYAAYWIRQMLHRYIENNGSTIRKPAQLQSWTRSLRQAREQYEARFGRVPGLRELAALSGLTINQAEAAERAERAQVVSLDAPIGDSEDSTQLLESIPDEQNGVEDLIEEMAGKQISTSLWAEVDRLPGNESDVIRQIYQEGEEKQIIAAALSVAPATVTATEKRALQRLRNRKAVQQIAADAIAYEIGLRSPSSEAFNRTRTSSTEAAAFRLIEREQRLERQALEIMVCGAR